MHSIREEVKGARKREKGEPVLRRVSPRALRVCAARSYVFDVFLAELPEAAAGVAQRDTAEQADEHGLGLLHGRRCDRKAALHLEGE
jgi:hypothetical protein